MESFWKGTFVSLDTSLAFDPEIDDIAKWNDEPGGTVVDRYTEDGTEYVLVEFKNSPGHRYVYRA